MNHFIDNIYISLQHISTFHALRGSFWNASEEIGLAPQKMLRVQGAGWAGHDDIKIGL